MAKSPFVVVDWGTSSFRLWSLDADAVVLAKHRSDCGMASLQPAEFETVLEQSFTALNIEANLPVIICGMAGAAQGWYEAPYMDMTEELHALGLHAVRVPNVQRDVYILPGVKQAQPANVMRGEETQLLGLLKVQPDFNGIVCLPGTHTKWVQLQQGKIQKFTTCMTGELFGLLANQSVLKHSVTERVHNENTPDSALQSVFNTAITEVTNKPYSLAEQFFSLRASTLLENTEPALLRARLSGLLIGFELSAMQPYWKEHTVVLIGEAKLCNSYANALQQMHVSTSILDAEQLTLNGLINAYQHIETSFHVS